MQKSDDQKKHLQILLKMQELELYIEGFIHFDLQNNKKIIHNHYKKIDLHQTLYLQNHTLDNFYLKSFKIISVTPMKSELKV